MEITCKGKRDYQSIETEYDPVKSVKKLWHLRKELYLFYYDFFCPIEFYSRHIISIKI